MKLESRYNQGQRAGIITLIANIALGIIKTVVGVLFNSQALFADGLHSASDVISTVVVMVGNKVSSKPPDEEHPYGHGKAESIATKVLGIILIIGGVTILKDNIDTMLSGITQIPGSLVLWTAAFSIVLKEIMYQYVSRVGERINNKALIADAIHHRTDCLSSFAAILGAGGAILGYPILDPLAGVVVALLILKMGFEVFKEAANDLMDAAPDEETFAEVRKVIIEIDRVLAIKSLKIRAHGPRLCIDVRVVVDNQLTVIEGHRIAVKVKEEIYAECDNIQEVLVHIDPEGVVEGEYVNS
ncbi:cation diffusion facilitator family transporter [Fuchsiella alkaliacetigena]|uniref:cation diffusion facilitator family transporter n=1 Tax=Fuchsiella alkaliacetigena TaxID=957042 RepID=UPI00200AA02A|nr:cation diffusion facilitator family transporter [Fuchsiella alkaliacetigena]MCK8824013.1 cation diffusion facilitator family transporter [Fuchsiella alkaliacetigena]